MSTATKARIDTAYQRLRKHLAYLGLTTRSEELAPALEQATARKLSAVEVLELGGRDVVDVTFPEDAPGMGVVDVGGVWAG